MPPVAVAIPILLMMRSINLDDTYPGLIVPYVAFSLPLTIWILIGFFDEVPRELDDAALVDGAARRGRSCRVHAAARSPGHLVAAIFGPSSSGRVPVGLYIVNSGRSRRSRSAPPASSRPTPDRLERGGDRRSRDDHPDLLFSLFIQRYIVRGVTAGAVR